jgi:hypothetical protein
MWRVRRCLTRRAPGRGADSACRRPARARSGHQGHRGGQRTGWQDLHDHPIRTRRLHGRVQEDNRRGLHGARVVRQGAAPGPGERAGSTLYARAQSKQEHARLLLWDTAGQEMFGQITKNYYRGVGRSAPAVAPPARKCGRMTPPQALALPCLCSARRTASPSLKLSAGAKRSRPSAATSYPFWCRTRWTCSTRRPCRGAQVSACARKPALAQRRPALGFRAGAKSKHWHET